MRRALKWIAISIVVLLAATGIYVYDLVSTLEHEQVTDDVFMITGLGGNVGVLKTERGAVIVDSMTFALQGRRIRELAERLAGGPTQAIINTHYHVDHTHGNPGFAAGTRVVSTQLTRDYMMHFDAAYWQDGREANVPNETFDDKRHQLRIGGKTIRLHAVGRGHTGGDLVVEFVEDGVIHAGDLFFHQYYPNIDLEAGGSVKEWGDTLDRVAAIGTGKIIPGHGPVTDATGLRAFQAFMRDLWKQANSAAVAGKTEAETLASVDLAHDDGFGVIAVPFVFALDRDFVVHRAWQEATGAVAAAAVPPSGS